MFFLFYLIYKWFFYLKKQVHGSKAHEVKRNDTTLRYTEATLLLILLL